MGREKGKMKKLIIEALKKRPEPMNALLLLGSDKQRSSIYENISRLEKNEDIELIQDEDGVQKYFFIDRVQQKVSDPLQVNLAIEQLEKNLQEAGKTAVEDLKGLSRDKKIMQIEAMRTIFKFLNNKSYKSVQNELCTIIDYNLRQYLRDGSKQDHEIRDMLLEEGCSKWFIKIARKESESPQMRNRALSILILLREEKRVDIAFKILEKPDDSYNEISQAGEIISNQARIQKVNIRKRLYDLLVKGDNKVQERALTLLDITRGLD